MGDKEKSVEKELPTTNVPTPRSDEDETASTLFASNVETQPSAIVANKTESIFGKSSGGQFKSSSRGKLNFRTTKPNLSTNVPSNSKSTIAFPDIPWPDEPCSVRELYKDYINPGDPFLNHPKKLPPRTLPKSDPTKPKHHLWKSLPPVPEGYSHETYMRLREAERKEAQTKMAEIVEAEKKEAELKAKKDNSPGGKDDKSDGPQN